MRQNKFRGIINKDQFVYGYYAEENGIHYIFSMKNGRMIPFIVDPKTVGQFTGLQDKNGVDIYGDDIVDGVLYKDYSEHRGKIVYDYSGYRIVTKDKSLQLDLAHLLTVIGNTHQNKELLDG